MLTLVGLLVGLMGCSSSSQPESKQILRLNIAHEPHSLDPRRGRDYIGSAMHYLLFEGLLRLSNDASLMPAQAQKIDISEDGLIYTFHLRDAVWSDGTAVTAQDFEHSWKTLLSPDFPTPSAHLFYPIKNAKKAKLGEVTVSEIGIVSENAKTLVVTLEKPTPYFLKLVAYCAFFPVKHTLDQASGEWMNQTSSQFISNGPFALKTWKHHKKINLDKNEHYWDASSIHLDGLKISMISDENTALNLYENGDLDILGAGLSPISSDAASYYHKKGLLHTVAAPATTVITFNTTKYPFNNINIRKAFSYAINRQQITQNVTQLNEIAATGIIPPAFMPNRRSSCFQDHDTQKAKYHLSLGLKELGISLKDFPKVMLNYTFSELNRKLAQVLQDQWMHTLGIQIDLHNLEHQVHIENLTTLSYDLAQSFWVAQYSDPMSILERFNSKNNYKNYTGWENKEYTDLLEESSQVMPSDQRVELLQEAESLIMEEMPIAPVYHWQFSFLAKDYVHFPPLLPNGAFDYSRIHMEKREESLLSKETLPRH
ncbi:peptide ABC transporter substrate-binding protein [Rhabdochlamydiaceae symbiont of Dictyostelium giganteum]|uniref:peptide ABC transporter substrate-binding protein n=1 Tax=Rhabdochlamydiaceae symbiont of Dictyostelium giganteum TaxID=3342349 RepID=UPI00384DCB72